MATSDWDQEVLQQLQGKMRNSEVFLALLTEDYKRDPTCLIQLGYAIMMEKPLIFVAPEGVPIPRALQRLADHIAYYKATEDMALVAQRAVGEAMAKLGKGTPFADGAAS